MTADDERELEQHEEDETHYDWSVYGDHEQATTSLEGKDYLAIFIASLQTIFLPIILLGTFLFVLGLIFGLLS